MKFDDVILGRRSIRGYKPDPVPRELIKEVMRWRCARRRR